MLTEPTFFDGSLAHLEAVRAAVDVPMLRKDFVVDEYQLLEARAAGADAVLLIVAALDDRGTRACWHAARVRSGSTCWSRCTTKRSSIGRWPAGADLIGVNNRNLRTLDGGCRGVGASGGPHAGRCRSRWRRAASGAARTSGGCRRLGYRAFLIGERFMTAAIRATRWPALLADAADA